MHCRFGNDGNEAVMGGFGSLRTALAAGCALAVGLAGAAFAQEGPPDPVSFEDPAARLAGESAPSVSLMVQDPNPRFAPIAAPYADGTARRGLELEVAAGGGDSPLDISVSQRASLGADANGDISRRGSGSEVRIGRGLVNDEGARTQNGGTAVYAFVASDDEALTWQPGSRSEFGGQGSSVQLQEQVEIGDMSVGVTYERNGVQASLAYVEREESTRVGVSHFSQDTSFTGVTVTMRR
jgi:hypothetical protein